MLEFLHNPRDHALLFVFLGAVGLLAAVFTIARAFFDENNAPAGRRAIAHWLPIATAAIVAVFGGSSEMALGIVFGTSVAALSVVMGFVALASPLEQVPTSLSRLWPFLPVAALLLFVLGFRGQLGLTQAALLLAQGAALMLLRDNASTRSEDAQSWNPVSARPRSSALHFAQTIAAVALAAVTAYAVSHGLSSLSEMDLNYPAGVMASTIISAVLALPMVSTGAPSATRGRPEPPIVANTAVVLLNICLLLPALILLIGLTGPLRAKSMASADTMPTALPDLPHRFAPVIYPRVAWRIDAIAILILSLAFMSVSAGKIKLDRRMGIGLIVFYCLYLLGSLLVGVRQ